MKLAVAQVHLGEEVVVEVGLECLHFSFVAQEEPVGVGLYVVERFARMLLQVVEVEHWIEYD